MLPVLVERELRWSVFHYRRKQRCIFCDIVRQEERSEGRIVATASDYVSLCPYASRFPYEVWVVPREHNSSFEQALAARPRLLSLARFLKSNLLRIQKISHRLRFSLHTEPNMASRKPEPELWQTVPDDYHWHIEMYPELGEDPAPFDSEGFYYNAIPAEEAAGILRKFELEP